MFRLHEIVSDRSIMSFHPTCSCVSASSFFCCLLRYPFTHRGLPNSVPGFGCHHQCISSLFLSGVAPPPSNAAWFVLFFITLWSRSRKLSYESMYPQCFWACWTHRWGSVNMNPGKVGWAQGNEVKGEHPLVLLLFTAKYREGRAADEHWWLNRWRDKLW